MNLYRGENRLFTRTLFLQDGTTELLVSELVSAQVELRQGSSVVATYVWGTDSQLRAGSETNELVLEITSALSLTLQLQVPLEAKWTFKVTDADFESEPDAFIDIMVEQLFANVL